MDVNGFIAFFAGMISFFSPCVLPLVPSYLIFLSGATVSSYAELAQAKHKKAVLVHSCSFIVGFSLVFISLGVSSSFLGGLLVEYQKWVLRLGGLLLVIMGLNSLNVLKIPFLNQEKMVHLTERPIGLLGSFAIGAQNAALTGNPSTDYSTHTLLLHIQDYGSMRLEMGYASAVAVVLFVIMTVSWTLISKVLNAAAPDQ